MPEKESYNGEMMDRLREDILNELEARRRMERWHQQDSPGRWRDSDGYYEQRMAGRLRSDIRRELAAMEKMEQRMGRIRDPQVRQMLSELVEEARDQGLSVADLSRSMSYMDRKPSWLGRLGLRNIDRRSFFWGAGAALLASAVLPTLSGTLKPLASKAVEGMMDLSEKAQGIIGQAKEEIEDIVAEAKFNKFRDSIDAEPTNNNGPAENDNTTH